MVIDCRIQNPQEYGRFFFFFKQWLLKKKHVSLRLQLSRVAEVSETWSYLDLHKSWIFEYKRSCRKVMLKL